MLDRYIDIPRDLALRGEEAYELVGDEFRITIHQPQPLYLGLRQPFEKRGQPVRAVQIDAVPRDVLRYEDQFADAVGGVVVQLIGNM